MGRTIVVTGASRGLGRAMVDWFTARGHVVVGCARDAARINAMNAAAGPRRFAVVDVADPGAVGSWADGVVKSWGSPDLVINNAALINAPAASWRVPASEWERVLRVNVLGVANVVRAFAPAMIARGVGVFANFSSGWGRSTAPEVAPYCAAKFAVEGMTRALAQELPSGLAAVAVNPGVIDTDMLRCCFGDSAGAYPTPGIWVEWAGPFLLNLGPDDNGESLDVPVGRARPTERSNTMER